MRWSALRLAAATIWWHIELSNGFVILHEGASVRGRHVLWSSEISGGEKDVERTHQRAEISILRCDQYSCERQVAERGEIFFSGPATDQIVLIWDAKPRNVLVLLKPDPSLLSLMEETVLYLKDNLGLRIFVEERARDEILTHAGTESFEQLSQIQVFQPGSERSARHCIDFVVTLGGDGLLMHSSTLFPRSVPPHVCFNLGSMGFLTPFKFESMREDLKKIVLSGQEGIKVSLRMRLAARIIRGGSETSGDIFNALNEVVVERAHGASFLSHLECYCDDQFITTVQADGLIIATPTGSTAYSMSAGGSMVHPSVPAILVTPICPHSLSFRPIVFPDSVSLRCEVPDDARGEAFATFDGKHSQPLRKGDSLVIKMSPYPVPTACIQDSTADWFSSLDGALGFNVRVRQKEFVYPVEPVKNFKEDRSEDADDVAGH